jgi:hypothetical protein
LILAFFKGKISLRVNFYPDVKSLVLTVVNSTVFRGTPPSTTFPFGVSVVVRCWWIGDC